MRLGTVVAPHARAFSSSSYTFSAAFAAAASWRVPPPPARPASGTHFRSHPSPPRPRVPLTAVSAAAPRLAGYVSPLARKHITQQFSTTALRTLRPVQSQQQAQFRSFHVCRPCKALMLTGPALTCLLQVTRTIITALPILWRWNVAKSHPRLMWALASVPLLGMFGLVAFAYEEHPLTQRSRLMFIDQETEHQLSAASYPKIVDKHRHQLLANTHPDHRALASIASELLKVVGPVCDWKLHVIADDRVVNAFVSPTGNIFVYTGLLRAAGSSDEVAAILAHELAHVISRHGAEKLGFQHIAKLCWDFVHSLVYTVTVNLPMLGDVVGRGVDATKEMITSLPYSRMCEKEADTIGMYLMAVAGYNPRAAVEFWDKMDKVNADNPDRPYEFLSDHPSHDRRAQDLRQHLPSALGIFRTRGVIAGKIAAARGAAPTTMEDFNRGLFEVLREHLMPALEDNTANDGELARQTATLAKECFWQGSRKLQGAA